MAHVLSVVGIGPGDETGMTKEAYRALEEAEVIIGYTTYVELLQRIFPEKTYLTSGMTREEERCLLALEEAKTRARCALISSGDAGIYGMASLLLEKAEGYQEVEVRVIPGVTAALSGAALLGAPLSNDTALISLSDRLTPWDVIVRRLRAAAEGDFSIVLYNPASKGRTEHLQKACDELLQILPPDRVCGIARNIGREGEEIRLLLLSELREYKADMTTTVFIGASDTVRIGDHLVTRRGYEMKTRSEGA